MRRSIVLPSREGGGGGGGGGGGVECKTADCTVCAWGAVTMDTIVQ